MNEMTRQAATPKMSARIMTFASRERNAPFSAVLCVAEETITVPIAERKRHNSKNSLSVSLTAFLMFLYIKPNHVLNFIFHSAENCNDIFCSNNDYIIFMTIFQVIALTSRRFVIQYINNRRLTAGRKVRQYILNFNQRPVNILLRRSRIFLPDSTYVHYSDQQR